MQTSAAAPPAGGERLAEAPPAPGAGPAGTEPLRSWAEGLIEMFAGPLDLEKPEVQVAVVAEGAGSEDREMEEEREQDEDSDGGAEYADAEDVDEDDDDKGSDDGSKKEEYGGASEAGDAVARRSLDSE